MNITGKGDKHLGAFFVPLTRAVVRVATNNINGSLKQWVNQLKEQRDFNKANVDVANKNPGLSGRPFEKKLNINSH